MAGVKNTTMHMVMREDLTPFRVAPEGRRTRETRVKVLYALRLFICKQLVESVHTLATILCEFLYSVGNRPPRKGVRASVVNEQMTQSTLQMRLYSTEIKGRVIEGTLSC